MGLLDGCLDREFVGLAVGVEVGLGVGVVFVGLSVGALVGGFEGLSVEKPPV